MKSRANGLTPEDTLIHLSKAEIRTLEREKRPTLEKAETQS
jgi:hypothetical protein